MKAKNLSPTKRKLVQPSLTKRFETFLGKKRHSAHVMSGDEFDADAPSRPIVRLVVVLLLLHIVVVGGILVRGQIMKSGRIGTSDPVASSQGNPSPDMPAVPATAGTAANALVANEGQSIMTPSRPLDLPEPIGRNMPPDPDMTSVDEPVYGEGTASLPAPVAQTAIRSSATEKVTHLSVSGDTWESIGKDYACTPEELMAANPGLQLRANVTVLIPPPPGVVMSEIVDEAPNPAVHVMKKGDNLTKIAKLYKTSVAEIMKLNNFKESDLRRLQIGQEIKIP